MSNEEKERRLGAAVLELRDKNTERCRLEKQADGMATYLKQVQVLHDNRQYDAGLAECLTALQEEGDIVQVFQDLIRVTKEIAQLRRTLNVDL